MARRLPAPAPELAGYTYIRPLGSGGFADVYLYQQHMPQRTVAVKVLLPDVAGASAQQMFLAEATMMAQLASHPAVLTVYEANIAADGRPYLVMEYCPTGYGQRFRTEDLPMSEVLNVAISIGGVLETAHRAGVLHRDIKPANVLITQYGRPVLSDFGIAATVAEAAGTESMGLSIPWSAPEVISGRTGGTVRTEVWGFCATIYALLAKRSPFETPGTPRTTEAVQKRILSREAVKPTGRRDVPPELERALAQGLSKDPAKRQGSILEVLHTVQMVETGLGMRPTPLDVPSADSPAMPRPQVEEAAAAAGRARGTGRLRDVAPQDDSTGGTTRRRVRDTTIVNQVTEQGTVLRSWNGEPEPPKRRRGIIAGLVAGLLVVAVGFGVAAWAGVFRSDAIPQVGQISSSQDGTIVRFTWKDPGLRDGDTYLVRVNDQTGTTQSRASYSFDTSAQDESRVCLTVSVVRNGTPGEPSSPKCAEG